MLQHQAEFLTNSKSTFRLYSCGFFPSVRRHQLRLTM